MLKIQSSSGHNYCYDTWNNKISLWDDKFTHQANPIVEYVENDKPFDRSLITMFTIEMTQQCNLRCTYCCYSGNYRDRRTHNKTEISWEKLEKVVGFIKDCCASHQEEFTICFYGGEALLAIDKIRWVVESIFQSFNDRVIFSLSTNGLNLNDEVIEWICSIPRFWVNVTIDGNKEMHDKCRKTINGRGSFDTIHSNLAAFKHNYPIDFQKRVRFLSTVASWSTVKKLSDIWHQDDVLRDKLPVRISHLIPNFEDEKRTYDSKDDKDAFYGNALRQYKLGYNNIETDSLKRLINIIERRQFYNLPTQQNIITCLHEMYMCFINVSGDLYACEKFCGEHKIGSVERGFDNVAIKNLYSKFVSRKAKFCSDCWASRLCRMCLTSLNFKESEIPRLCEMEKETLELALKYYCEVKEFESVIKKNTTNNRIMSLSIITASIGLQLFNTWQTNKKAQELQIRQQEFQLAVQSHDFERMRKLQRESSQLSLELEAEVHKQRLKDIESGYDDILIQFANDFTIKLWPLKVLPFVMRGESFGTYIRGSKSIALHCILTPSNCNKFNAAIYEDLDLRLESIISEFWNAETTHPVVYYGGGWRKSYLDLDDINLLHMRLKNIPMIVLTPYFDPNFCLKLRLWGMGKDAEVRIEFPDDVFTYDYKKGMDYFPKLESPVDDLYNHTVEELVTYFQYLIGYITDKYFWEMYECSPVLPAIITKEVTTNVNLVNHFKNEYIKEYSFYKNNFLTCKYSHSIINYLYGHSAFFSDKYFQDSLESLFVNYFHILYGNTSDSINDLVASIQFSNDDLPFLSTFLKYYTNEENLALLLPIEADLVCNKYKTDVLNIINKSSSLISNLNFDDAIIKCWENFDSYIEFLRWVSFISNFRLDKHSKTREWFEELFNDSDSWKKLRALSEKISKSINAKIETILHQEMNSITSDAIQGINVEAKRQEIEDLNNRIKRQCIYFDINPYELIDIFTRRTIDFHECNANEDFIISTVGQLSRSIRESYSKKFKRLLKCEFIHLCRFKIKNSCDEYQKKCIDIVSPSPRRQGEGCFLTTAMCKYYHKSDNCYELNTLRWFRDNWLINIDGGEKLIAKYYTTAPQIVNCLEEDCDRDALFIWIHSQIQKCVSLIEKHKYKECFDIYSSATLFLARKYNLS